MDFRYNAAQAAYDNQVPLEKPFPKCPVCGSESNCFYKQEARVLGCEECIESVDAWEEFYE